VRGGSGERLRLLAFAIPLAVFREQGALTSDGRAVVAGRDKPLEAELIEVGGEVLEEVTFERVIAVAVDNLAAKGVGVELKISLDLFLDVGILGVKLVLLGFSGPLQIDILRDLRHGGSGFAHDRIIRHSPQEILLMVAKETVL
jgi:hypothetical protein